MCLGHMLFVLPASSRRATSVLESSEGSLITCLLNEHANTYLNHPFKVRLKSGILPVEQTVVGSLMFSACWGDLYHPMDWTWSTCCLLPRCERNHVLHGNKVVRRTQFHPKTHTPCKTALQCRAGSSNCAEELCLSHCCALMITQPQNYVFFRSDGVWDCQSKFISDVFIPLQLMLVRMFQKSLFVTYVLQFKGDLVKLLSPCHCCRNSVFFLRCSESSA